jgi:hypothetical protein
VTRKTAAVAVALAVAAVVTGGLTMTSSAAPSAKAHTKHYDARTVSLFKIDKLDTITNTNLKSRHLASAGKIKGAVVFTCHRPSSTATAEYCKGAIALKQGMLFATAKLPFSTAELSGRITGGNGRYKGAHGSITAVGSTRHHSIITITYKT